MTIGSVSFVDSVGTVCSRATLSTLSHMLAFGTVGYVRSIGSVGTLQFYSIGSRHLWQYGSSAVTAIQILRMSATVGIVGGFGSGHPR